MRWYDKIIAAHTAVTNDVSHGYAIKKDRYMVWLEDDENDFVVGGKHVERAIPGSTDIFTKTEFDPWVDDLRAAFEAYGILYRLNSKQFEEDTGFWHTEFLWEVADEWEANS